MKTPNRILGVLALSILGFAHASPAACPDADAMMSSLQKIAVAAAAEQDKKLEAKETVVEFNSEKAIVMPGMILIGQVRCGQANQFLAGKFVNSAGKTEQAGWIFSHRNGRFPTLPVAESSVLETDGPSMMTVAPRLVGDSKLEAGAKLYIGGEDVSNGSPYTSVTGRLILPKAFIARNFPNGLPDLQGVAIEAAFTWDDKEKKNKITQGAVLVHTSGDNCGVLVRF